MGTPSADITNARSLFQSKIKPSADAALRKNRDMAESVKLTALSADSVILKHEVAPLQLYVTEVKAQTARVEASIAALDACIAKVQDFAKAHKAALADLPEVATLNDELAEERRKASTRIAGLKAARSHAEQAARALAGTRTEMNAEWATIERDARTAHQEVLAAVKVLYGHRDRARAALKAHDRKAYDDARAKAEQLPNPYLSDWPARIKRKLADFATRYEKQPKVDKAALDQLKADKAELNGVLERIALNAKLIDSVRKEIMATRAPAAVAHP
jgi:chromosome segregation ATPase